MLGEFPRRTDWLDRISVRASVAATRSPIEDGSPAR
jgi:hypothetical protein